MYKNVEFPIEGRLFLIPAIRDQKRSNLEKGRNPTMEVTEETAAAPAAKTENMQYYHIAPSDLGRDISPAALGEDDDDDDDPNWLMMTSTRRKSSSGSNNGTNVIARQTCSADSGAPPPPLRNGGNRLSRLIEGVATAIIGPTEDEEDADVIVGESAGRAPPPLPAYYQDDPIAARICELFDEMEPLEKIFAENNNLDEGDGDVELEAHRPAVVKLRPKAAGGGGIFGRKKQAVSGYFSDWTKWLRGPETSAAARGAANEGSGKCNGRE